MDKHGIEISVFQKDLVDKHCTWTSTRPPVSSSSAVVHSLRSATLRVAAAPLSASWAAVAVAAPITASAPWSATGNGCGGTALAGGTTEISMPLLAEAAACVGGDELLAYCGPSLILRVLRAL